MKVGGSSLCLSDIWFGISFIEGIFQNIDFSDQVTRIQHMRAYNGFLSLHLNIIWRYSKRSSQYFSLHLEVFCLDFQIFTKQTLSYTKLLTWVQFKYNVYRLQHDYNSKYYQILIEWPIQNDFNFSISEHLLQIFMHVLYVYVYNE